MTLASIDMGSIPESIFESELFGYERGAFTGARDSKAGRMEAATNGTLFLDEIGNLSYEMQGKLLTAIEKHEISRLGSTRKTSINVRLICATNANIKKLVEEGKFRQDLYFRINTIEIEMPPLRERGEDIILLAEHFMKHYANKCKKTINGLTREAKQKLMRYNWPGNVRELQHIMEKAVILADSKLLKPDDFNFQPKLEKRAEDINMYNLEEVEKTTIERAVKKANGNLSYAAELLGITRYTLYRKIEKFGL
jgi:transcriptional regulator with PAS, ATPase and Fis domain